MYHRRSICSNDTVRQPGTWPAVIGGTNIAGVTHRWSAISQRHGMGRMVSGPSMLALAPLFSGSGRRRTRPARPSAERRPPTTRCPARVRRPVAAPPATSTSESPSTFCRALERALDPGRGAVRRDGLDEGGQATIRRWSNRDVHGILGDQPLLGRGGAASSMRPSRVSRLCTPSPSGRWSRRCHSTRRSVAFVPLRGPWSGMVRSRRCPSSGPVPDAVLRLRADAEKVYAACTRHPR